VLHPLSYLSVSSLFLSSFISFSFSFFLASLHTVRRRRIIAHTHSLIGFTITSVPVANLLMSRQKVWLEAVQRRVHFTTNILVHLKSVKMMGLGDKMQGIIRGLRDAEIEQSKRYRRVSSFNICLSKSFSADVLPCLGQEKC
jgi:hypothetical protein